MTPLEKAKQMRNSFTCKTCSKGERVNGTLYCGISGKIILPTFEDVCCCRGKYFAQEKTS